MDHAGEAAQKTPARLRLGISLSPQSATWSEISEVAKVVDRLGYDYLWTWDHLLAPFGRADQPIFESQTLLAAISQVTTRVRLGTLVCANTFRQPVLLAKVITTIDHVSNGRAVLGMGAGWFETEHVDNGIEFGRSVGERLDRLGEAVEILGRLLDGETVRFVGRHYRLEGARIYPGPYRESIPLLIAGSGERKTLPIAARHADIWNAKGTPAELDAKRAILDDLCGAIGRDPAAITKSISGHMILRDNANDAWRVWQDTLAANGAKAGSEPDPWFGTPEEVAERLVQYAEVGFTMFNVSAPAPFDVETIERFVGQVGPTIARSMETQSTVTA